MSAPTQAESNRQEEVQQDVREFAAAVHGTAWKRAVLTIHDENGILQSVVIRPNSVPHFEAPSTAHPLPQ